MERRTRSRVTPSKDTVALLSGSRYPAKVIDYSAGGIAVKSILNGMKTGKWLLVDIVVDGKLCACSIPGQVCWTNGSTSGISFSHSNDAQMTCAHKIETQV